MPDEPSQSFFSNLKNLFSSNKNTVEAAKHAEPEDERIEELIENSNFKKTSHFNFSNYDFSNLELKKIYLEGDPSSHLNQKYHTELFIKNVLNELQKTLRFN